MHQSHGLRQIDYLKTGQADPIRDTPRQFASCNHPGVEVAAWKIFVYPVYLPHSTIVCNHATHMSFNLPGEEHSN